MDPHIAVASAYLDALRAHADSSVACAPGAGRHEFGARAGFPGNHLRRSLSRDLEDRVAVKIRPARHAAA
ncbi:hypothetical protein ABH922_004278 [Rhodococcus sp. 27YEA15]|uniref:hypothetical protein n=1 Tax=Rhodococcus sp. 27YEA15 TaxID=3156259 RepID=UPI003C7B2FF2